LAGATVGERVQGLALLMSGELWRSTHMNPTRLGASSTFPGSGTNQFTFKLGEAAKNREHQSATHGDMSEFNRAVAGLRPDLAEHGSRASSETTGPCDNRFGRPDNGLLRHTVFVARREDKPANEVRASGRGSDGDDRRVEDMA
jgi:hypothetical protein